MKLRDLKEEIIKIVPKEYKIKTNFSSNEFIVECGELIINAKTICTEEKVYYEFVLDVQFVSNNELTFQEIVVAKNIIELLNQNKELAISRLKKWTVEEYLKDQEEREKRSEEMLEALRQVIMQSYHQ